MDHRIYPAELQLNKANVSYTEVAFEDFIMIQFKYMINVRILILILLISRSLMAMYRGVVPLMVYIYFNLFALPKHIRMLVTCSSKFLTAKLLKQAIHLP